MIFCIILHCKSFKCSKKANILLWIMFKGNLNSAEILWTFHISVFFLQFVFYAEVGESLHHMYVCIDIYLYLNAMLFLFGASFSMFSTLDGYSYIIWEKMSQLIFLLMRDWIELILKLLIGVLSRSYLAVISCKIFVEAGTFLVYTYLFCSSLLLLLFFFGVFFLWFSFSFFFRSSISVYYFYLVFCFLCALASFHFG